MTSPIFFEIVRANGTVDIINLTQVQSITIRRNDNFGRMVTFRFEGENNTITVAEEIPENPYIRVPSDVVKAKQFDEFAERLAKVVVQYDVSWKVVCTVTKGKEEDIPPSPPPNRKTYTP